jgi:hypothetical protein
MVVAVVVAVRLDGWMACRLDGSTVAGSMARQLYRLVILLVDQCLPIIDIDNWLGVFSFTVKLVSKIMRAF